MVEGGTKKLRNKKIAYTHHNDREFLEVSNVFTSSHMFLFEVDCADCRWYLGAMIKH